MPSRGHTRAERMKEYAAVIERARQVLGAMGLLVRGRELRKRDGAPALEVEFADTTVGERALPAAVWVALRRDDVDAAIDAMAAVSEAHFLVEERDVMGDGYRLQSVQDTLPLPETELLTAQLSAMLGVPLDVLTILADWGPDDPRAGSEVNELLTSRFGRSEHPGAQPAPAVPVVAAAPDGRLSMTVAEAAEVLRLDDSQTRALTTLVRNATVTLTLR